MHLILLSGGSGKRLWPLSNDVRSKQFLKVLHRENRTNESMVQRVYRQIVNVGGWDSVTVAAGVLQKDQLELQLGHEINIVIEPERRDTFPAIVLACAYLYSEKGVSPDESVAVLPVDPYVDDTYFQKIAEMDSVLQDSSFDLVLMGAQPVYPSEKYGYIIPESILNNEKVIEVKYFKEKPSEVEAEELIKQGAVWNCGVFGLKISYIFDILASKYQLLYPSYSEILKRFKTLAKTSFDYEVVEKAQKIAVTFYNGKWKDLGTWETLTEEMSEPYAGNVIVDASCENNHIINELDIPLVAMGIRNSVIVANHDGILVSEKGQTYKLKEILLDVQTRPMYERRRWGEYVVLDHIFRDHAEILTKRLLINPGLQISYQYHIYREEIWTIVFGSGILYLEDEFKQVFPGDIIHIKPRVKHGIMAKEHLEVIEVQLGKSLVETDIVRIDEHWSYPADL